MTAAPRPRRRRSVRMMLLMVVAVACGTLGGALVAAALCSLP